MWRLRKRGGRTIPQACTILTDGLPNVSLRMESCAEYADPEAGSCAGYADLEAVHAAVTSEGAAGLTSRPQPSLGERKAPAEANSGICSELGVDHKLQDMQERGAGDHICPGSSEHMSNRDLTKLSGSSWPTGHRAPGWVPRHQATMIWVPLYHGLQNLGQELWTRGVLSQLTLRKC